MPKSKRGRRSKNKTGYIGVYKNARGNTYAAIQINGKLKYLGSSYDTAEQAAKTYDKEAIKLRRPLSKLNYPKKAPVGYTPIQQPLKSNNIIGYRGVAKRGKKFQSSARIGGKVKYIGTYDTAREAAIAYDRAVLKTNKSKSLLNFPDMVHNLDVEPKRKKYKRSSTGYRGVTVRPNGRFCAKIGIAQSRSATIGTFNTAIQAALAFKQQSKKATNLTH